MFEWATPYIQQVAVFFFGTVLFKYVFTKAIAGVLVDFLKFCMLRTQEHIVMYIHYREKAMNKGHQYDSPDKCKDGVCLSYQSKIS
jgi:hypothetical protein